MSITFKFTYPAPTESAPSALETITFGELGNRTTLPARMAMFVIDDASLYNTIPFHPPGVDGNIIVVSGKVGKRFSVQGIYYGAHYDILDAYQADCDALAGKPFTFTDARGREWTRCRLEGMTHDKVAGVGKDGNATDGYSDNMSMFTVQMTFTSHDVGPGTIPTPTP